MKRLFILLVAVLSMSTAALADEGNGRVQVGVGLFYEKGMDMTVGYEYETRYHNAWEFFGNTYLKWEDCLSCGHICPDSFWKSYNT